MLDFRRKIEKPSEVNPHRTVGERGFINFLEKTIYFAEMGFFRPSLITEAVLLSEDPKLTAKRVSTYIWSKALFGPLTGTKIPDELTVNNLLERFKLPVNQG